MGHQLYFFAGPNDLLALEARVKGVDHSPILHQRSFAPTPRVLESTVFKENGKQWLYFYLIRSEDLASVKLREVATQGYWVVEDLTSPVVELNRCYYDGKILRRGRLYYTDGYFEQSGWIEKSPEFIGWAKRIFAAARKSFKFDRELLSYIGPEAKELLSHGVQFTSI
jgi:hypothetical protein